MKQFLKLFVFGIPALAVHAGEVVLFHGKSTGFPNWVADRKIGDPKGCPLQTRDEVLAEQQRQHSAEDAAAATSRSRGLLSIEERIEKYKNKSNRAPACLNPA